MQDNLYTNDQRGSRMFVRICPYLSFSAHPWLAIRMCEKGSISSNGVTFDSGWAHSGRSGRPWARDFSMFGSKREFVRESPNAREVVGTHSDDGRATATRSLGWPRPARNWELCVFRIISVVGCRAEGGAGEWLPDHGAQSRRSRG